MRFHIIRKFSFMVAALMLTAAACQSKKNERAITRSDIDSVNRMPDPSARILVFDKWIKDNPNNAALYMAESKAYDDAGNLDKALENAKTAIEKDSSNTEYYFYMSDLFMKKPSARNAVNTLERLIVSHPDNKMAYIKLAELYIKMGKTNEKGQNEDAMRNIEKALKLDRNIPEAYFWMGYIYRDMKDYDKAVKSFRKAVELKPDYTDAYVILGLLSQETHDPKAEEYFTSAIRLNPKDTMALYDRGKLYQDMDSFQKAIDDYQKILELDPGRRSANYGIAYCMYYQEKYSDALGYFSKVLLSNPKDAAAHYGRSLCYEALHEMDKASKEKAIAEKLYAEQGAKK